MKSSTKGKLATFCIATGVQYLVNVFLDFTWDYLYKKICWKGKGMDEKGYETRTNNLIIAVNRLYFRSTGVETLLEDPSKAKEKLGWEPKITFLKVSRHRKCEARSSMKRGTLVKT